MSKYIYNRLLRQTMESIITKHYPMLGCKVENPVDEHSSIYRTYRPFRWPFLDKSLNKLGHTVAVKEINFDIYCFCIYTVNTGYEDFPLTQMVVYTGSYYSKKQKIREISPSYIRDLKDFEYYFRTCMDILNEKYLYLMKKKKEIDIENKKYRIRCDTFDNEVDEFLNTIAACKDGEWEISDTYWEEDILRTLSSDYNESGVCVLIHKNVKFVHGPYHFNMTFIINPDTNKLELDKLFVHNNYYFKENSDQTEFARLHSKIKNCTAIDFFAWFNYFLDNVKPFI